jgi:hypothetical protein
MVAAFAVVPDDARAGAKGLTWLTTRSAAAWAIKACSVVGRVGLR